MERDNIYDLGDLNDRFFRDGTFQTAKAIKRINDIIEELRLKTRLAIEPLPEEEKRLVYRIEQTDWLRTLLSELMTPEGTKYLILILLSTELITALDLRPRGFIPVRPNQL